MRHTLSREFWLVTLLLVGFACLRWFNISAVSLSMDETFTRYFSLLAWDDLHRFVVKNDMHPPAYFALTKLSLGLGDQETGVRSVAWLFGTLTLIPIYLAGRLLGGAATGVVALVFAGLSYNQIDMSHYARAYSAMTFFTACGTVVLAWIATKPSAASQPFWSSGKTAGMYGLGAVSIAALPWMHNIGALYGAGIGLGAVLLWVIMPGRKLTALINILSMGALSLLLFAPHLPDLIRQNQDVAGGFWAPDLQPGFVIKAILSIFGTGEWPSRLETFGWILSAFLICFGAAGALVLLAQRKWTVLLATVFVPVWALGVILGYSVLVEPIFLERLLSAATAPWIVLLAITATTLWASPIGKPAVIASAAILASGPITYFGPAPLDLDWRALLNTINTNSQGRPVLFAVPNSAAVLAQYQADKYQDPIEIVAAEGPYPVISPQATYPTGWRGVPELTKAGLDQLDDTIAKANGDVWLMLRGYWSYDPQKTLKPHLDDRFCYRFITTPAEPFFFFVKLVPLDVKERADCIDMGDADEFPYMAGRTGDIEIRYTD